ncbi:hypothetical protein [Azospirillum rugosum]|uniref:Sec-independent protein translocase protein TatA n=1 Tax=Azospirillum rugosum TaxID=416170 RepID=A0ABS4SKE6_9PROT|nr:hypothetical protein [Azospirillum rugosum]MBP2293028.1 Sec-independent protein translocase protein TatA [Azospirillum rugosum]MDQ0526577.1 Sec-independent protein translocase protein TatA [Azospirillum rugosum]
MKPHPISVAAALLFAACTTTACTADIQDEMPGQAGTSPTQAQAPAGVRVADQTAGQTAGLKTFRQLQDEANAQPLESSRKAPSQRSQAQRSQNQDDQTRQRMSQDQQQQQPPVRRRGSSSPPPPPIAQQVPQGLPPVGSTEAQTDRFKRDLLSPEVDRLRTDDAMGRLDPLQQRELFRKEQDLRQYGTGPRGY